MAKKFHLGQEVIAMGFVGEIIDIDNNMNSNFPYLVQINAVNALNNTIKNNLWFSEQELKVKQ